jgi:hypothetical protein
VKAFDHGKPANKDEWVFAFVRREVRQDTRDLDNSLGELSQTKAAEKWLKELSA